jgi:mono/diheme cytochrome c family protein
MKMKNSTHRGLVRVGGCAFLTLAGLVCLIAICQESHAGPPWTSDDNWGSWGFLGREHLHGPHALAGTWYSFRGNGSPHACPGSCDEFPGGQWFWAHSPEEERAVSASLFNRYCIRCHGVDGRGVWDIPGVPDFTNSRWQISRSDDQIARIIIEGRGAVMPTFRGTLSLEEAWAMARYLRTLVPGAQASKPDLSQPEKEGVPLPVPEPVPQKQPKK